MNEVEKNPNPDVQKLAELIQDIKIAMLTTVSPTGALISRPMAVQETSFAGDLWFFTSKASGKCETLLHDKHVNVAFVASPDNRYVSVSGQGEIIDDREKEKELWNPLLKAWFPKGLEDPDLVLLKVSLESAEYWDSPSSAVVQLIGFAKAVVTGQRYQPGPKEHDRLNLGH